MPWCIHMIYATLVGCHPGLQQRHEASSEREATLTLRQAIFRNHDPYANLTLRPFSMPGTGGKSMHGDLGRGIWGELVRTVAPRLVVEVGVHYGGTSIPVAMLMRKTQQHGTVLAVDTWLGATDWWGDGRAYWHNGKNFTTESVTKTGVLPPGMTDLQWVNGRPSIYLNFLSNVVHRSLQDWIVPFPIPARQAADFLSKRRIQADIVHVDGSHEYADAISDLQCWWPIVRPGGVLVGDDFHFPDVRRAFAQFAHQHNLKIETRRGLNKALVWKPNDFNVRLTEQGVGAWLNN